MSDNTKLKRSSLLTGWSGRALGILAATGLVWAVVIGQPTGQAETLTAARPIHVRVGTYNIENFTRMFDQQWKERSKRDMGEYFRDEEDLYEVSRTIKLPMFQPDILGLQECCDQKNLDFFNSYWLAGKYKTAKVFASNSTREQNVGMLVAPGYKILEVREFNKDVDPVRDKALRGYKEGANMWDDNLLFSRGPAFVLVETPNGRKLWVGVTHVKSKYGNSEAVTRWRIREITRTREICGELLAEGKTDLLAMIGDFNDTFGKDEYEEKIGADAVGAMMQGKGKEELVCPTLKLLADDPKLATYHCELKPPKHRSFIDHIFLSPALAEYLKSVRVIREPIAAVASDHYPVAATFEIPAKP